MPSPILVRGQATCSPSRRRGRRGTRPGRARRPRRDRRGSCGSRSAAAARRRSPRRSRRTSFSRFSLPREALEHLQVGDRAHVARRRRLAVGPLGRRRSSKTTMRFLPRAFAVIIADSAQATSSRGFIACSGPCAMPTEIVISPRRRTRPRASRSVSRAAEAERVARVAGRHDHRELLAAEAADDVGARGRARAQHLGERDEHLVARAVAADVVDALEVVDVEHQQRDASRGRGSRACSSARRRSWK